MENMVDKSLMLSCAVHLALVNMSVLAEVAESGSWLRLEMAKSQAFVSAAMGCLVVWQEKEEEEEWSMYSMWPQRKSASQHHPSAHDLQPLSRTNKNKIGCQ